MARKKVDSTVVQPTLIDTEPENMKEIIACARRYKAHQKARMDALAKEVSEKEKLKGLIRDAGLQPLDDGSIAFTCGNFSISVTPRDELVKVTEASDE